MNPVSVPVVFIPALLCDEAMFRDLIAELGDAILCPESLRRRETLQSSNLTTVDSVQESMVFTAPMFTAYELTCVRLRCF